MEELLTPEDLTKTLKVERTTLYRWARQGVIPAIKVGKYWRFRESDVEAALNSNEYSFNRKFDLQNLRK